MPVNDCPAGCPAAVRKPSNLLPATSPDTYRTEAFFRTTNQWLGCPEVAGHLLKMNAKVCLSGWGGFFRTPPPDTRTDSRTEQRIKTWQNDPSDKSWKTA